MAAAFLLTVALPAGSSPAWANSPPSGVYIYAISRDGAPVGQQRLEFVGDQDKLRVLSHTDLTVKFLGLNLYGFNQQIEELRQGERLIGLTSEADDDGKDKKVSLALKDDRLRGNYNGNDRDIDPRISTSLFWQQPHVGVGQVLDCLRARVREITVADLGQQTIDLPIGRMAAHHYRVSGALQRDLWYDAAGILLAGQLTAKDGSSVRQELQQRP